MSLSPVRRSALSRDRGGSGDLDRECSQLSGKVARAIVSGGRKAWMMGEPNTHLTDEELLLFADGEARGRNAASIREHLTACWSCRLRLRELEDAITEVARMQRQATKSPLPPPDGPRALLRARLRQMAASRANAAERVTFNQFIRIGAVAATVAGVIAILWIGTSSSELHAVPRSDLTPGAIRSRRASDICSAELGSNAQVLPAVKRQVFTEYGMPE